VQSRGATPGTDAVKPVLHSQIFPTDRRNQHMAKISQGNQGQILLQFTG
jgi:hypothetical protein